MITKWFIQLVKWIVVPVFNVLPTGTISWLTASGFVGVAQDIGANLGGWDGIFPIVFILNTTAATLGILLPALMIYKFANWIWGHIPQIAGTGPS